MAMSKGGFLSKRFWQIMATNNNKSTEKIVICVYPALFSIVSTKSGPVTIDSLCVQSSGYELSGYKGSMLALRANDYVMNRCFKGFFISQDWNVGQFFILRESWFQLISIRGFWYVLDSCQWFSIIQVRLHIQETVNWQWCTKIYCSYD